MPRASIFAKRNAVLHEEAMQRLCAFPKLTWADRVFITGISNASLQRHYGR